MRPEDREALIEAGYDPDDSDVRHRMALVDRGLALLRDRLGCVDAINTRAVNMQVAHGNRSVTENR